MLLRYANGTHHTQSGVDMEQPQCGIKEMLAERVRNAVAHEKELETQLPEPAARKDAGEQVEVASLNLREHVESCKVCKRDSAV
jgi:hypothetical protein